MLTPTLTQGWLFPEIGGYKAEPDKHLSNTAAVPQRTSLDEVASTLDPRLEELCRLAGSAAASKGHQIGEWTPPPGADEQSRRANCQKCGMELSVRVGEGMTGMAGQALRSPCS